MMRELDFWFKCDAGDVIAGTMDIFYLPMLFLKKSNKWYNHVVTVLSLHETVTHNSGRIP
ncbi:MAG: hypothetical protein A3H23_00485 [Planctomycetes bacterium RIFCSPLOWO2_12_FULL_40_19]|nr:MAG: hypothetical protein A3H23_00485 [Planctomycetes bacterium RIFCSPLOWO2_12_FULL_40_19]